MNFTDMVSYLLLSLLTFAMGIFYVLSMIEKPIWSYMYGNRVFPNEELMRQIQAQLKRLIPVLPPTMGIPMFSSMLLIPYQYFMLKSTASLILLIFFFVCVSYLFAHINKRIDGVKHVENNAGYSKVSTGVIRLARMHHEGLFTVFVSLILQFWVVSSV